MLSSMPIKYRDPRFATTWYLHAGVTLPRGPGVGNPPTFELIAYKLLGRSTSNQQ